MTKKYPTHVATFRKSGNDWDWIQLYSLSDEQLYTLAAGIPQAPGGFPPLLPIDEWCRAVDHFNDLERRVYHRDSIYFLVQQPAEA